VTVLGDEQILRLDVAMRDAALVGRRQTPSDLDGVFDRPSRR
jgi:hypothetical protein